MILHCPACDRPARIPAEALGGLVQCPHCDSEYTAVDVPTVQVQVQPQPTAVVPTVYRHPAAAAPDTSTAIPSYLAALALIPLGIPLLWLLLTLVAPASAFSFATPVVVALSITVLAFGLAAVRIWSGSSRIWGLLLLNALAYLGTLAFYFAPTTLLEFAREFAVFNSGLGWKNYEPPKAGFGVRVPTGESAPVEFLTEWPLDATTFQQRRKPVDQFVVAHGKIPLNLRRAPDEEFWAGFRKLLSGELQLEPTREQRLAGGAIPQMEYLFELPDGSSRVIVRAWRKAGTVVVLSIRGPFLYADRPDVQYFLKSLKWTN